jgi:hypothetical protein
LKLAEKAQENLRLVESKLVNLLNATANFLIESYEEYFNQILIDPGNNNDQWKELRKSIEICEEECLNFAVQLSDLKSMWELVHQYSIAIEAETCETYWRAFGWPSKISNELDRAHERLESSKVLIRKQMSIDRDHCSSCIEAYEKEIEKNYAIDNLDNYEQVTAQVKMLRTRIDKALQLVASVNSIETLVGDPISAIAMTLESADSFTNQEEFWYTVEEMTMAIDRWLDTYFMDLQAEDMLENMDRWKRYGAWG